MGKNKQNKKKMADNIMSKNLNLVLMVLVKKKKIKNCDSPKVF